MQKKIKLKRGKMIYLQKFLGPQYNYVKMSGQSVIFQNLSIQVSKKAFATFFCNFLLIQPRCVHAKKNSNKTHWFINQNPAQDLWPIFISKPNYRFHFLRIKWRKTKKKTRRTWSQLMVEPSNRSTECWRFSDQIIVGSSNLFEQIPTIKTNHSIMWQVTKNLRT